jgi:hypothetical protein
MQGSKNIKVKSHHFNFLLDSKFHAAFNEEELQKNFRVSAILLLQLQISIKIIAGNYD